MPDQPAPAEPVLQRDHVSLRGTIRYTSKKPERLDQERGRETFQMNVHADGRRTLIAECEIDDRPSVTRYVVHSLDADWLPTDCFVRLAVGDRFQGTGWFRFTARAAECESFTAVEGRVSQQMALDGPCRAFGNHAISGDGLLMHLYDLARGPGVDTMDILLSSPDHRGAVMGRGLVFIQTERYQDAIAEFDHLIGYLEQNLEPDDSTGRGALAAAYANRGIVYDRLGQYETALASYVKALATDEESVAGPGVVHKILYESDDVSSVRKRAQYIYEQLQLPESERLMRVPEIDAKQRMHKP